MAGHSKWSQIKRKKAKTDAQRGKLFSKLSREIITAARLGGDNPDLNARLRFAIQKAKEMNLPQANIQRCIQKGAGNDDDSRFEEIFFEAYGAGGVAILIKTLTDNRIRTVANIKAALTRHQASMASKGAVSYLFSQKGVFVFSPEINHDQVIDIASQSGADDVDMMDDGSLEIYTRLDQFETVKKGFESQKLVFETAFLTYVPSRLLSLNDKDTQQLDLLIEKLEEDDDIQDIFYNT